MVNYLRKIDGMNKPIVELIDYHVISACDYEELGSNVRIYNLDLFGPTLHVQVKSSIQHSCRLMDVYESNTCCGVTTYTYDELDHPWVDIPVDCLNLDLGLHTYTLEFVNVMTGDTYFQYFNYIIQTDSPDKPYIYMDR